MDISEVTKKAGILIEALPYIKKFSGSTFVVKYGGAFMDDPDVSVRARVAQDIAFLAAVGINVVVVHGGGKAINRAMEKSGLKTEFKNGMRVTDKQTVGIVENVLNNEINSEICDLLKSQGANPSPLTGNNVLVCEKLFSKTLEGEQIDLGFVGKITIVKAKLIKKVIAMGATPVISPIALDDNQMPYNTNADVAASAVASALKARRLVFLCDVPGLMTNPKDKNTLISSLKISEADELKRKGIISGGMLPKVDSGIEAIRNGVRRVHFVDGYMPHSLLLEIFTDKGIGTEIVHEEQ